MKNRRVQVLATSQSVESWVEAARAANMSLSAWAAFAMDNQKVRDAKTRKLVELVDMATEIAP